MRLFLAIPIPQALQQQLKNLQPLAADGVSLTRTENMHITLVFIGDGDTAQIEKALAHFNSRSLLVQQEGLGIFKGRKRSILWAGLAPNQQLFCLRENLTSCLARRGISFDLLEWQAHITLARCSTAAHRTLTNEFLKQAINPTEAFKVEEFALYNSVIEEGLTRYKVVSRYALQL